MCFHIPGDFFLEQDINSQIFRLNFLPHKPKPNQTPTQISHSRDYSKYYSKEIYKKPKIKYEDSKDNDTLPTVEKLAKKHFSHYFLKDHVSFHLKSSRENFEDEKSSQLLETKPIHRFHTPKIGRQADYDQKMERLGIFNNPDDVDDQAISYIDIVKEDIKEYRTRKYVLENCLDAILEFQNFCDETNEITIDKLVNLDLKDLENIYSKSKEYFNNLGYYNFKDAYTSLKTQYKLLKSKFDIINNKINKHFWKLDSLRNKYLEEKGKEPPKEYNSLRHKILNLPGLDEKILECSDFLSRVINLENLDNFRNLITLEFLMRKHEVFNKNFEKI